MNYPKDAPSAPCNDEGPQVDCYCLGDSLPSGMITKKRLAEIVDDPAYPVWAFGEESVDTIIEGTKNLSMNMK